MQLSSLGRWFDSGSSDCDVACIFLGEDQVLADGSPSTDRLSTKLCSFWFQIFTMSFVLEVLLGKQLSIARLETAHPCLISDWFSQFCSTWRSGFYSSF
jgi:hypothetical protein